MLAKNDTPFAAIGFEHRHRDGQPMAVVSVRGSYDLFPDSSLALREQQELVLADIYQGFHQESALLRTSDLIPFKPKSDITVVGYTYAPHGKRLPFWRFGYEVNQVKAVLCCYGLRDWLPDKTRDGKPNWRLSETKPIERVPLDYHYSAGSRIAGGVYSTAPVDNPIGAMLIDADQTPPEVTVPAAMILRDGEVANDPFTPLTIAGTAPVPPFWKLRQRHAGTYDKAWEGNRYPQLPADFNYLFYQTACPGLIWPGFLKGDETITLHNLISGGRPLRFQLPKMQPFARFEWLDGRQAIAWLNLDGLHIDTYAAEPPWRIDLTWRGWSVICPQFFKIDLAVAAVGSPELDTMLHCTIDGLAEGARA